MADWILGIDGCPGGWVGIGMKARGSKPRAMVAPELVTLVEAFPKAVKVGVDMPLGLPDNGPRECDQLARERLGRPRAASVFAAPIRPALGAESQKEASRITREAGNPGVSIQAWNLFGRVRELDSLLASREDLREKILEIHPELAFRALNGKAPLVASKHKLEGLYQRRGLLAEKFGMAALESAVDQLAGERLAEDDLLDAFAVLWSTRRHARGKGKCLPKDPPHDARGLPMRICF